MKEVKGQELEKKATCRTKKAGKTVITDLLDLELTGIDNPVDLEVIGVLSERGAMTRRELVRITTLPRSTLYDSLTRLQLAGLVDKFGKKPKSGPGRAVVVFESIFNTEDG
ncbi:MAG: helix-turn-helix domain-containing protein [Candidatus Odinarchaeota archaeon]